MLSCEEGMFREIQVQRYNYTSYGDLRWLDLIWLKIVNDFPNLMHLLSAGGKTAAASSDSLSTTLCWHSSQPPSMVLIADIVTGMGNCKILPSVPQHTKLFIHANQGQVRGGSLCPAKEGARFSSAGHHNGNRWPQVSTAVTEEMWPSTPILKCFSLQRFLSLLLISCWLGMLKRPH